MRTEDFIHPDDAAALKTLKAIPAFPTIVEAALHNGLEDIMWCDNITSNIRLSKEQMPEIYDHLPPICEKLGIAEPELYLNMSPIPNAWTSGHKRVYIVLTLGLIRRCKDQELDAALAHECGHILCEHVLYTMIANAIFSMSDILMDSLFGAIGNLAMKPVKAALCSWQRASELSADRVATIVTSATVLSKTLAKLDGVPKYLADTMDLKAWAKQGYDFEQMRNGTSWNKAMRMMANSELDHPYGPVRAYEAMTWESSEQFRILKSIQPRALGATNGKHCPQCGAVIDAAWGFCKYCGKKLN